MNTLKNLRLGVRLGLAFAVVLLFMVAIAMVGLRGIGTVSDALRSVYLDRTVPLGQLAEVNRIINRNRVLLMDMMARPSASNIERRNAEFGKNIDKSNEAWKAYIASAMTKEEAVLVEVFAKANEAYVKQGLLPVRDAIVAGQSEAAEKVYAAQVSPLAPPAEKAIGELMELQVAQAATDYAAAQASQARVTQITAIASLLALAVGSVLAWWITQSITTPIRRAVEVAETVAGGDLRSRIEVNSKDETGQLLAALKRMNEALVNTVSAVRGNADSVATASSQIAQGNIDLSQRTEEQASNLQQTAASMEQLTATVKQNADTARQAAQLATSASGVAGRGGEVVGRVVSTMEDISASSKKIADIIGTIDGIAFQTNILALNAAVEAARAGEQGRGFAVVAGEVRSLAQRSAEAAKEIKSLIGASVEKVEAGTALVGDAGTTMDEIVGQVKRVSDLLSEISAASIEQTQGIGQIGDAVNQLDQVTQQNAALVEESAAAAESLKLQAAQLSQAVAFFSLRDSASPQMA